MKGFLDAKDIALAVVKPTNNPPNKPGPAVAAIASIWSIDRDALFKASLITLLQWSIWLLAASSGTTPKYSSWVLICE